VDDVVEARPSCAQVRDPIVAGHPLAAGVDEGATSPRFQ
jgi:hypothetical protein